MPSAEASSLRVNLLGTITVAWNGQPIPEIAKAQRLQELIAYLLLHRNAPQPRAHLAYLFWPDSSDQQARTNLRQLLRHLKQALPKLELFIAISPHTLTWRADAPCEVDVARFETSAQAGLQALHVGREQDALAQLEAAASSYQGELLPGVYQDWVEAHRHRLQERVGQVLGQLVKLLEQRGEWQRAASHAEALARHDPLAETSYQSLIRLYTAAGDRAKALHSYHRCVTILERELGAEPSPDTQALYRHLVQQPATPTPTATQGSSPFVGREAALEALHKTWRAVTEHGPHVAFLSGEAGLGKTRLIEVLRAHLKTRGVNVLAARCYPAEGGLTFAPVVSLLRSERLHRDLSALSPVWLAELTRLVPELRDTYPALPPLTPLREGWQRQRFFEALSRAALLLAPLLLVIDDAHWCDQDSAEWLHFLCRFDAQAAVLVMLAARPEELLPRHPLRTLAAALRQQNQLQEIPLAPLGKSDAAQLARHLQVPGERTARLVRESEGNPLFITEMARAELSSTPTDTSSLPPKLQALLEQRLARLSPSAQALAETAAVIGRTFSFKLLTEVSRTGEAQLVDALDELWQKRVLREEGTLGYDFSHEKLREVAYHRLSRARQRLVHRYVAEALEVLHEGAVGPVAASIASHYERAGVLERAVPYYLQAGQHAAELYASEDAASLFEHALTLLERVPDTPSRASWRAKMAGALHEALADLHLFKERRDAAREHYHEALEHASGAPIRRARIIRKLGMTHLHEKRFGDALATYQEAERVLEAEVTERTRESHQEWIELRGKRIEALYFLGEWQRGEQLVAGMKRVVDTHGTAKQRVTYYQSLLHVSFRRERYAVTDEMVAQGQAILSAAQERGDALSVADGRFSYGFVLLFYGDLPGASEQLGRALALARQSGHTRLSVRSLAYLSVVSRLQAQPQQVATLTTELAREAEQSGSSEYRALALANRAWLAYRDGHDAPAQQHARRALTLWADGFHYPFEWLARFPLVATLDAASHMPALKKAFEALLDAEQQKLPEALAAALTQALACKNEAPFAKAYEVVLERAHETGML